MVLAVGVGEKGLGAPNRNGDTAFTNNDPSMPNEPFWAHIDRVIEVGWSRFGIRICMVPSWGTYTHGNENQVGVFGTKETARPFGKFIGAR